MAYQSLYRKYRPQRFADVMGQGHVTRTLQNALAAGRVAHGYLFTGTRGTAKTTVARLLAKALNCEHDERPTPEPCNECDACAGIAQGACIDVVEMDAASHRGVADIEEVRKAVGYGPMQFRYKVFIIDEAHQLSSDAKDAFLKTLEEPPDNVVFILATTEPQAIPITIRSRCQQFDFKRGSLADISGRLRYVLEQEGVSFTPEAVNLVARGAEGSWRDALSLLEQVLAFSGKRMTESDVETVLGTLDREMLGRVTEAVAGRDAPAAFALAGALLDAGKEARTLLRTLSGHFRDLLLVSVGGPAVAAELTPEEVVRLQAEARRFAPGQMLRAIEILNEAQGETRWNNQHRLLVELAFLKLMDLGEAGGAQAGAAARGTFATAPIVFPADRAAVPAADSAPPPEPAAMPAPAPAAPIPAPAAAADPPPRTEPEPAPEDALPAGYFAAAGSGGSDDTGEDDEDEGYENYEPGEDPVGGEPFFADAGINESAVPTDGLIASPAATPDDEVAEADEGPGLFDEVADDGPAAPAARAEGAADASDATRELAAVMTPGRGAPAGAAGSLAAAAAEDDAAAAPGGGIPLERVLRVWPRFLQEAERISKMTRVMMDTAVPTGTGGKTITITFRDRANHAMMDKPRNLEFVRKLLARCLDRDSVQVRFLLDTDAAPPPPPPSRTKAASRDRLAQWDAEPLAASAAAAVPPADDDAFASAPFPQAPSVSVAAPPPSPAPSRSAFAPGAGRAAGSAAPAPPREVSPPRAEPATTVAAAETHHPALDDPLVQETLSIFGGEIVDE